jgi:hypothetical protein
MIFMLYACMHDVCVPFFKIMVALIIIYALLIISKLMYIEASL